MNFRSVMSALHGRNSSNGWLVVVLILLTSQHSGKCSISSLAAQPCNVVSSADTQSIDQDCKFSPVGAGNSSFTGRLGLNEGPPAVICTAVEAANGLQGTNAFLRLSYVILVGCSLPQPGSDADLIPLGLLGDSSGFVALQDVRILVNSSTLQQYVENFTARPAFKAYTDGVSFLHVNWHATARASWQSVGLLLATDLQDARATSQTNSSSGSVTATSRYNYVLAARNATLVPLLQRFGATATAVPALVYVDANVTLSKPPVPQDGILVNRPVAFVGLTTANTSLDFHMTVNSLIMTAPWSNITFDSLVIENQAPGDARSAEVAKPASVSSAGNFWALYFNRTQRRLTVRNCTLVVGTQEELDYYLYWATVFHSPLPYFQELARFVRETMQGVEWQLLDTGDDQSMFVVRATSSAASLQDTLSTVRPVVAVKMQQPPVPPQLQLQQAQKSPLVLAVTTTESFLASLAPLGPSEANRPHVVLLRGDISLSASTNDTADIISSSNTSDRTSFNDSSSNAVTHIAVAQPITLLGDLEGAETNHPNHVLDWGWQRAVLLLPDQANSAHLQVQHLVLSGLAQGAGAAGAIGLDSPDVWTILLWAVRRRTRASVALSACTLELPPPEFNHLKALAAAASASGGPVVLRLARNILADGIDGLLVFSDMTVEPSGSTMHVRSLTGHGLNGTNLTLVSSTAAAEVPGGYFWPGGEVHGEVHTSSRELPGAAVAAAVVVPVVVVAVVAVAAFVLVRRRRIHRRCNSHKTMPHSDKHLLPQSKQLKRLEGGSATGVSVIISNLDNDSYSNGCKDADDHHSAAAAVTKVAAAVPQNLIGSSSTDEQYKQQQQYYDLTTAAWGACNSAQQQQQQQQNDPEQQQQQHVELCQRGLQLLRARPHGTLVLQEASQEASQEAAYQPCFSNIITPPASSSKHTAEIDQMQLVQHQQQQQQASDIEGLAAVYTTADQDSFHTSSSSSSTELTAATAAEVNTIPTTNAAAPKAATGAANPASDVAAAAGAGGDALPRALSGSRGSTTTSKSWQRVTGAISLLQRDITLRRLQAGMAASTSTITQPTNSTSSTNQVTNSSHCCSTEQQFTATAAAASYPTPPAAAGAAAQSGSGPRPQQQQQQQVQLLDMIGRGTFASVYRGVWRGRCVAVKVVHLPGEAAGKSSCGDLAAALQTRERMAVMEAVVSITMSHPNIVQVFTFALKPLPTAMQSMNTQALGVQPKHQQQQHQAVIASGWELQLVMQYCEEGSLRQALNQGRLTDPTTSLPLLPLVLALAHDVACAMLHLHSEKLIHADLKASNVLLTRGTATLGTLLNGHTAPAKEEECIAASTDSKSYVTTVSGAITTTSASSASSARSSKIESCAALLESLQAREGGRLVAKVADFGLSLSLNAGETHVSHMHAGTLTHMAPELLLHGRASTASDVYAFGILLWELLTGQRAFLGMPVALLGHNVVHLRWRPQWVAGVPRPLMELVEQCWAQEPAARPSFHSILLKLEQLLQLSPEQLHDAGASNCPAQYGGSMQQQSTQQHAFVLPEAAGQSQQQQAQQQEGGRGGGAYTGSWSLAGCGGVQKAAVD